MERTHWSAADVLVGFAHDGSGRGIAYAAIANGSGRGVMRIPFSATPLALYEGREYAYAAVAALGAELRKRGFARIRVRLADDENRPPRRHRPACSLWSEGNRPLRRRSGLAGAIGRSPKGPSR